MANLIYSLITSLDGFIADQDGNFGWAEPDEEVHSFVNELERPVGTYLYGRRMYEVMVAWETLQTQVQPAFIREFANIWRTADKVVYSNALEMVSSARTRIEREFEPEAIRQLKASAAQDVSVGGPNLASQAFKAGLIDVCHLFVAPVIVGDGKSAFPSSVRMKLVLQEERRFGNGMVYLHYRSANSQAVEQLA